MSQVYSADFLTFVDRGTKRLEEGPRDDAVGGGRPADCGGGGGLREEIRAAVLLVVILY